MPARFKLTRSTWANGALLAILVATTAWLSLTLARGPGELAAIWVGNGIVAGWLLSRRTAAWPFYIAIAFLAELPARMLAGDDALYAFAIAGSNLVETLAVAGAVRRSVPDVRKPDDWMRLGWVATGATLAGCALSGAIAAAVAHLIHGQPLLPAFTAWYAAHVVGMVVLGTTTLVAQRQGLGVFLAPGHGWSLAASLAILVAVSVGVFLSGWPVMFLAYPALLLVAVRHRLVGVALGVITLGLVAAVATTAGHGPLTRYDLGAGARIALIQLYLAGGCLMTIPICLAMAERKRLATRLADSERRYRMLADYSHDVIARVHPDGRLLYVSPAATEMFGWPPGWTPEARDRILHPEDLDRQLQSMAEVLASGEPHTEVYRVRHADGHYVWIEAVSRRIPADDGDGPPELMLAARNISRRVAAEQALAESRAELERLSRVDSLTGLANRRQFDERFALALKRLKRHGIPVTLMYLDVDHFKQVNDRHGHAAGDAVLTVFGRRLADSVRETDLVARIGGDEFAILIEAAPAEAAEIVARKVVASMAGVIEVEGTAITVTSSIGIAHADAPVEAPVLMARADAALYAAKHGGRNRYQLAPPG